MKKKDHRWGLPIALALAGVGCAELTGVDEYVVGTAADTETVVGFLAAGADDPTACATCVEQKCAPDVGACANDAMCGPLATCMAACSDPACLLSTCRGASQPGPGTRLGALSDCATNHCLDDCSIGKSWGCSGKYIWPAVPQAPFHFSFAFDLFNLPDSLTGAPVRICDYGATCLDKPSAAYSDSAAVTGSDGSIQLLVKPVAGTTGSTVPPWFLQIGQNSRTLAHRLEAPQGMLRPLADVVRLPLVPEPFEFPPGHPGQETRYLAGLVFDCRGSRVMAGAGLKIFLHAPGFEDEAFYRLGYWSATQTFRLGPDSSTFLSGVFSIMIGTGPRPRNDYPEELYTITAVDAQTGTEHIRSTLRLPAEGHMALLLFPRSRAE